MYLKTFQLELPKELYVDNSACTDLYKNIPVQWRTDKSVGVLFNHCFETTGTAYGKSSFACTLIRHAVSNPINQTAPYLYIDETVIRPLDCNKDINVMHIQTEDDLVVFVIQYVLKDKIRESAVLGAALALDTFENTISFDDLLADMNKNVQQDGVYTF